MLHFCYIKIQQSKSGSNMSNAYWRQWSSQEIISMHGVEEEDEREECEVDYESEQSEEHEEDRCPRCGGGGCNWCLMLDY